MSLVRAIEIYDAYRGAGAGVRLGTSRVRWAIESAVAAVFEVGIEDFAQRREAPPGRHLPGRWQCISPISAAG